MVARLTWAISCERARTGPLPASEGERPPLDQKKYWEIPGQCPDHPSQRKSQALSASSLPFRLLTPVLASPKPPLLS